MNAQKILVGIVGLVVISSVCFTPFSIASVDIHEGREHARLFYYRHSDRAYASLKKNYKSIDVLAPQVHTIDGEGVLEGEIPKKVRTFARKKSIHLIPLVTNGAFDRASSHAFLESVAAQDRAIEAMIDEALDLGYAGWQIDFEQINAEYKDRFTQFIERASVRFGQENLSLSVAVVAKISDTPSDYPNDLWKKLIGVYDYAELAEHADFISVMSYDEPYKTGPVAPLPWLERVLTYTLEHVPAEKISLGVPLYYWERENSTNRIMEIGGSNGVKIAKKSRGAKQGYSTSLGTAFVSYVVDGTERTLWHENAKSMNVKLDLVERNGLHGFSAWALGLETPETHRAFSSLQ